ncbi:MAG: hypothetical protein AB7U62_17950 [Pseudolabrys sp.]
MKRRDDKTIDLFKDYTPKPVVARFAPEQVRAATCAARVAMAVSATLKDCGRSRDAIAQLMSEYLGETITSEQLYAYTSPARDKHNISTPRLVALAVVTKDVRLFNALLDGTGFIAVDARFETLIRRELAREARDKLDREITNADAEWKANR